MPTCRYEIFEADRIDGQPFEKGERVKFAAVGQPVYHKWTCDTTHEPNIFCMTVKSCSCDDGAGNSVKLLDEEGCALDRYLLQNLEYTSDLEA
uniref:ZP domain-containing protein n=1 Tax=Romanomermis culicivorax TaxID=13658 RepID=A0A915KW86_ROMCU